jgi:molybdopterin-binding protein
VTYDGASVDYRDRLARRCAAAVFQRPYLLNGTVERNVGYGLRLRRVTSTERRGRVEQALQRVGLAGSQDRAAATLSGGEAQRVALARALVLEPRVLFLDEPLSSLDALIKTRLLDDFARILSEASVTTVYVTHDQSEATVVSDRIAILRDGRIVRIGTADDVMTAPTDDWVAGFVGMEPPLRGVVADNVDGVAEVDCGGTSVFALSELPVGASVLLSVRPEDVTLFESTSELPTSSARNCLRCAVTDVSHRGPTVRVVVESGGVRLAALVSRASARELALAPGATVVALFKATATRAVAARQEGEHR